MHRIILTAVLFFLSTTAEAGIIATVDFAPGAETITFTGADRGAMSHVDGDFYLLEWRRDLLPPERVSAGSDGDTTGDVFQGNHVASDTDLSFEFQFRAEDSLQQFTLEPSDFVFLRARLKSTSLDLSTEVVWQGSGQAIDISHWNDMTLWNLQEAVNSGSLPLTAGSGWDPVTFQSANAASVPEPSSFILFAVGSAMSICFCLRKKVLTAS